MVSVNEFLTIAGISTVCMILVEMFKRLLVWDADATRRFAPVFSIIIGITGSVIAAVLVGPTAQPGVPPGELVFSGILTGILGGAGAVGLYNIGGASAIRAVVGPPAGSTDAAGPHA